MVFTDNIGNVFLGDCIYANHNIDNPTVNFLKTGYNWDDNGTSVIAWLTQAGYDYSNVINNLNTQTSSFTIFEFTTPFDTFGANPTTKRFRFRATSGGIGDAFIDTIDNNGTTNLTGSRVNQFNQLVSNKSSTLVECFGVCNSKSLCFGYVTTASNLTQRINVFYAGFLDNVNPNAEGYYSLDWRNNFIAAGFGNNGYPFNQFHYKDTRKQILTTEDAQYPIVCSDGQTPTSQWATDFYVFDNNADLEYPAIGKVPNLLLATGTYTLLQPIVLQGVVTPDAGFNRWLPVSTFAGKTLLMRCYSSVNI